MQQVDSPTLFLMKMRKIISGLFISLNGVVESPVNWQFDNFDTEMMAKIIFSPHKKPYSWEG